MSSGKIRPEHTATSGALRRSGSATDRFRREPRIRKLAQLRESFEVRGLHLDDDVVAFLRIVNGTSFDGLMFGGAAIRDRDPFDRADLVDLNDEYNDQPSRYTLHGTWDLDLYRFDNLTRKFEALDNGGGGVVESFATFGELVNWAITTHILKPGQQSEP